MRTKRGTQTVEGSKKIQAVYIKKWRKLNPKKFQAITKKYKAKDPKKWNDKTKQYQSNNPRMMLRNNIKQLEKIGRELNMTGRIYGYALQSWNKSVREILGNNCFCGDSAVNVHHIFHKIKYPKLSLNVNNGIPLCKIHHFEAHGKRSITV